MIYFFQNWTVSVFFLYLIWVNYFFNPEPAASTGSWVWWTVFRIRISLDPDPHLSIFVVVNLSRYLKCLFYLDLINVGLQQAWEGGWLVELRHPRPRHAHRGPAIYRYGSVLTDPHKHPRIRSYLLINLAWKFCLPITTKFFFWFHVNIVILQLELGPAQ